MEPKPVKLTPEKALSFLLDRFLFEQDYISMHLLVKGQGADVFPPYDSLRMATASCRPPKSTISITEDEAKVSLQALLDHTVTRKTSLNVSDRNLSATTLIPLHWPPNENILLWNNQLSQSSRFFRPLNLQYVKESEDVITRRKA